MHIALLASQVGWELEQAARHVFRPHGLSPAQFNVLNLLAPHASGLRASDLAAQLVVDPSNITRLLAKMRDAGWLEPVDYPADRRQYVVTLTPAGRKLWSKADRDYRQALAFLAEGLPDTHVARAQTVLETLRRRAHELRA